MQIENSKMKMIQHLGLSQEPLETGNMSTPVNCSSGLRRSIRSLIECIVPCCCASHPVASIFTAQQSRLLVMTRQHIPCPTKSPPVKSTVIGTFFGYCRGCVNFCLHDESCTTSTPLLLLEFTVLTAYLAKEMRHSLLRIALECNWQHAAWPTPCHLFAMPIWTMYCNGRKLGFAVKRKMNEDDATLFEVMKSVSTGAGVLPEKFKKSEGELMYLRARFERVVGSVDSESFHLIDPLGITAQQLSIFLVRT
ncbi:hypothetical protein LUZ63_008463 [Rhynchospora breviuscula]|uniref:Uncharacterized protein n=1 Tax=Rhynchospora breviuscula TaxID=2022672 RepID=A0A9Q0CTQ3_9POAL|nr:hypothetical protein LUZ63_008463 [Rhynchospora breviuscula]